ncbi:MSF1-domain-containing protein [Neoconidiobolus thromboides FSU 785]|nr:MSF1-domain-containing protein [Neoconidiobolus thromboides FSU 785]
MVKIYQHTHDYDYSWPIVSFAFWLRYPNPFASHVLGSDVIDRYIDNEGILHTTRIILKKGKLPKWGENLIKTPEAYIIEETTVDPKNQILVSKTKNLNHARVMKVEETQTFKVSSKNKEWTSVKTEARIISRIGWGITSAVERFGINKFEKNTVKARMGMSYILERIREGKRSFHFENGL